MNYCQMKRLIRRSIVSQQNEASNRLEAIRIGDQKGHRILLGKCQTTSFGDPARIVMY